MTSDDEYVRLAHQAFDAARAGDAKRLGELVEAGVAVNLANQSGDTLLMLAAYHGHVDAVRALLRAGAEADRLNDRGQSPLAGAVFKGFDDVARALVDAGADPDAGEPSAAATALMFDRRDFLALVGRG